MKKAGVILTALSVCGVLFLTDDAMAIVRHAKKLKAAKISKQAICPLSLYLPKTKESLAKQNAVIDAFGLPRVTDSEMFRRYIASGHFVVVAALELNVADEVGGYAIPPTRDFFLMVGKDFFAEFREKLKISSLLRTPKNQEKIVGEGRSIADGSAPELQSSHLAGVSGDISKKPLSEKERQWIITKLRVYKNAGKIEAAEEMCNNAFHIMVCPNWQIGSCL